LKKMFKEQRRERELRMGIKPTQVETEEADIMKPLVIKRKVNGGKFVEEKPQ
jgi:hypothetical protein